MASEAFDALWDEAFEREGELVKDAAILARIYSISSACQAIHMARLLLEAGRPLFEYCDASYKAQQHLLLNRMKLKGQLSEHDVTFIKSLLAKATKGW